MILSDFFSLAKARDPTSSRGRPSPDPPRANSDCWFWKRSDLHLLKLNIFTLHDTAISSNRNVSIKSSKILYGIIHSNTVRDGLKLETTQMTSNKRMDNVTMVYSDNGILYINENECITTTYVDMDESHHCNIEWKKPGTEDFMLYDSIYVSFQSRWSTYMLLKVMRLLMNG